MTARPSTVIGLIPPPLRGDARVTALMLAFEDALDELTARDLMLLDPADVREEALPYLAWEHSLDEFTGGDPLPVETVRDMIANAWDLHEPKGYAVGVEGAIATLGWNAELTQWWQEQPQAIRGTHRIDVRLDQPLRAGLSAGPGTVRSIWRMIHAMQRWSQDHALRVMVEAEVASTVGIGVLTAARIQIEPYVPEVPEVTSTSTTGVGFVLGWQIDILAPATTVPLTHTGRRLVHHDRPLTVTVLGDPS